MRRKTAIPPAPLPQRHGVDPVRLKLPGEGAWATLRGYLAHRLPAVDPARIDAMLRGGEIHGPDGPVAPDAAFVPGAHLWFYRDLPEEVPVPFAVDVLHQDEHLVIADKPHFLATTPRGRRRHPDGAVPAAARPRPARPQPRAPAGPAHRRAGHVRGPAHRAGRVPEPLPRPAGPQGVPGTGAVRARPGAAAHGTQPDRQGTRGDRRAGGGQARRTARA